MKAVRFSRFGGPEVLEIVDLPDPHPGPGQIRIAVRAAGVNPSDWKKRKGLMDGELPQTMGHEAAGVVDELGEGVADVAAGDRVFGFSAEGAAQAELAVLSHYAPIPPSLDFPGAAALPAAIETATRALDQLAAGSGSTLLINGASGSVGSAAVQLAVVRGARVIGTASPANHSYLRSLGAEPVAYGGGLAGRVRALAPDGVDAALDVAGSGVLPELIELAGGPEHVVTIADFGGAQEHGVRFSSGDAGRAVHALAEIGELVESGRFSLPVAQTFPLADIAEAHRVSEDGQVRGKLVLVVAGGRGTRHPGPVASPPELLSHGQVSLRRWRRDDAAALLAAVMESQQHLRPWMPWADHYGEDRAAEYLRECEAQWASGEAFAYAIIVGDQTVGSAGLHRRVGDGGLEIGYWVHGEWTGRGIATDAAAALTDAALGLPGIDRVEIHHDVANVASGRIPAKLGYVRLGEQPARDLWPPAPGETGTDVVWQITR